MPSPKLQIRRIVVSGELSMDQQFYPGLNIVHAVQTGDDIRSTNGCGKTSLVELIQHGLGRTHTSKAKFHFAAIIKQLGTLWLEFETDRESIPSSALSKTFSPPGAFMKVRMHPAWKIHPRRSSKLTTCRSCFWNLSASLKYRSIPKQVNQLL